MDCKSDITYPVAKRTLAKWAVNLLRQELTDNGDLYFQFTYNGSTCNNGGTPFTAILHAVISGTGTPDIIRNAWIVIPEDQRQPASEMCSAPGSTVEEAEPFFRKLAEPADFIGRTLESVILQESPENFAGCFCGMPHVNQKWKIALSTIHYSLVLEKLKNR